MILFLWIRDLVKAFARKWVAAQPKTTAGRLKSLTLLIGLLCGPVLLILSGILLSIYLQFPRNGTGYTFVMLFVTGLVMAYVNFYLVMWDNCRERTRSSLSHYNRRKTDRGNQTVISPTSQMRTLS